jgi:hypothetical protein
VAELVSQKRKCIEWFVNCCRQAPDNPYFVIERELAAENEEETTSVRVHESERKQGTIVEFDKFTINYLRLCEGEKKSLIKISVYSDNIGDRADLLYGSTTITVESLLASVGKEQMLVGANNMIMGKLRFDECQKIEKPNFIEYLQKGWKVNMTVAIDFTASNGDRHDINPDKPNEYEVAIQQVGKILENYSYKKKFSGYGFGGIPVGMKKDSPMVHCFPLGTPCEVTGLQNMLSMYRTAAASVEPFGPTFFTPVLMMTKKSIEASKDKPIYHVLIILTDGNIHDVRSTIDMVVECSFEPLSVIIIGIGDDSDFASMSILDADELELFN